MAGGAAGGAAGGVAGGVVGGVSGGESGGESMEKPNNSLKLILLCFLVSLEFCLLGSECSGRHELTKTVNVSTRLC